jgi:hypothetical protein
MKAVVFREYVFVAVDMDPGCLSLLVRKQFLCNNCRGQWPERSRSACDCLVLTPFMGNQTSLLVL